MQPFFIDFVYIRTYVRIIIKRLIRAAPGGYRDKRSLGVNK